MSGPFVHLELNSEEPEQSKAFYQRLFHWRFDDIELPDGRVYTIARSGDDVLPVGVQERAPGTRVGWLGYIEVPSVRRCVRRAAQLGAEVLVRYQRIPGAGAFAIIVGPDGATLGVMERASALPDEEPASSPGSSPASSSAASSAASPASSVRAKSSWSSPERTSSPVSSVRVSLPDTVNTASPPSVSKRGRNGSSAGDGAPTARSAAPLRKRRRAPR